MEDTEFKKIVKRARNRQTKKILLIYTATLLILGSIGLFFMSEYNYGFFKGEKVSGVQDNRMHSITQTSDVGSLLFDTVGEIQINTKVEHFTVYLDIYDHGELVSSNETFSVIGEEEGTFQLSGSLMYGIPTGERQLIIDFVTTDGHTRNQRNLDDLLEINQEELWSSQQFSYDGTEKIEKNKKYYLFFTHKLSEMYNDMEKNLSEEVLQEAGQAIVMYMVFQ